jgi:hypothetical protein
MTRRSQRRAVAGILVAALILPLSLTPGVAQGADPTAHVLIVANTNKRAWPDGGDKEMGLDRDRIKDLFEANVARKQLVLRVLPESEITPEGILHAIDAWPARVAPGDAFVFYYAGHGNYDPKKNRYFFRMLGPKGDDDFHDLLRIQVEERIKRKSPKHAILLTDCCSNDATPSNVPYQELYEKGGAPPPFTRPLFQYLLFEHTGMTNATSSKPGEISVAIADAGSLFTLALGEVLKANVNTPLTWKALLQDTAGRVVPLFKAELEHLGVKGLGEDETQHTQTVTTIGSARGPVFGAWGQEFQGMIVVTQVIRGTPAADAGIVRGDIIQEINGQPITSEARYNDAVDRSPGAMSVKVRKRSDQIETVTVKLDRPRR